MIARAGVLALLVVTAAGCGSDQPDAAPPPATAPAATAFPAPEPPAQDSPAGESPARESPAPAQGPADETAGDPAGLVVAVGAADPIVVEVADDGDERRVGLMGRADVPAGTGMLFVYPEPVERSFWMGNVAVPLSIAWVRDGRVVGTAEMTPCPAADRSCPRYSPGVSFDAAVETAGATFRQAGIEVGDPVTVSRR